MIVGWLVKIVVSFVLAGLLLVELGSPVVTRTQLDGVAHDAADSAAFDLRAHRDLQRARLVAQEIAEDHNATVETFTVDNRGLRVTVTRVAWSLVLRRWDRTRSWYYVRVTATASTAPR